MGVNLVKLIGQGLNNTIITGGLVPKGAYNAATDYAVGDSVDYNGSSYVMHTDAAAGTVPTDTNYWQIIASKGDTGAQGIQGEIGLNEVVATTDTNLTGILTGDGSHVGYIANNSANWDTAYGWGDHGEAGYLDQTAADLLYAPISVTQYTDEMAQDAIGNLVGAGLSYNDTTGAISCTITQYTDALAITAIKADADWNASDWDTAFGWGDHGVAGYAMANNVLELDNTTPFTPDADYEPATKKYVDDNVSGISEALVMAYSIAL